MAAVIRLGRLYAPGPLLAAAFAMLLLAAVAAVVCFSAAQSAAEWSRHTLRVELELDRAQILAMRAEINRRGFVMTGDPVQRTAFRAAAAQVAPRLDALERMVADNPQQRANVARLRGVLGARLTDMAQGIRLREAGRLEEAVALTRRSRAAIDSTLAAQRAVRFAEQRLLAQREARSARLVRWGEIAFWASALLLLGLAWLVWRERRARLLALSRANRELEIDMAIREQAEAQLEILAANATDAVVRMTLDGACLYASPSASEVFGVPASTLVGRSLPALVVPADRPAVAASLARLAGGERARELVTCRQRRGRGAVRWLEASSRVMHDASGAPREIIASVRDVTKRKQLELDLGAARRRAEEAAAAKAGFLANMSHEIRTPMNGVLGFTDLVLAGELTRDQRRYMELIAESGRAMMRILNDILDLSKIESGGMRIADETVDLRHVLRRCCGLLAPVAEQKGLALTVAVDPAVPMRVAGDPLRVRQILLNLIGNAIKFTETGEVTVGAEVVEGRLRIAVRDTGIGIPADRLGQVFQSFAQAEASTARRFGGTGLGLSISAELARLMGGGIAVDSELGVGSVFTLDLPLRPVEADAAEEAPSAAAPAPAPVQPAGAPLQVLIAEDHDINQELIGAMIRRVGAEPSIARDGAEAIAMVEAAAAAGHPYALVLMDMQMPEVDGIEATRRLRAAGHSAEALPIVALTANAFSDDVKACLDAGMQAHLAKPVDIAGLAATISRYARVDRPAPPAPPPVGITPALRERYLARKAATIGALDALLAGETKETDTAVDLLHKLSGTAGMFGEAAVGDRARALEQQVVAWVAEGEHARLRDAVEGLRKAG